MREIPSEMLELMKTPEFRAKLERDVAEPLQVQIANGLGGSAGCIVNHLSALERELLAKSDKPLPLDWESKPTLWELGDETSIAYGNLTHRNLIMWEIQEGKEQPWIVATTTEHGKLYLAGKDSIKPCATWQERSVLDHGFIDDDMGCNDE